MLKDVVETWQKRVYAKKKGKNKLQLKYDEAEINRYDITNTYTVRCLNKVIPERGKVYFFHINFDNVLHARNTRYFVFITGSTMCCFERPVLCCAVNASQ